MGLERVVQDDRGAELAAADDVGLGEAPLDVAALPNPWLAEQRPARHCLVGVEQRLEHLELDVDGGHARACLGEGVGADRGHRRSLEAAFGDEQLQIVRPDGSVDARQRERRSDVDAADARVRMRRPQDGGVEHPVELQVGGEDRLAAGPMQPVSTRCRLTDDLERPGGPLLELVLLDDDPDFLVAALDLFFRANQSRHVRIASSIFGYAPQRQRFPAIAWRISSLDGLGLDSTSATALTICPGVQKPHCSASERTNESIIACSRRPSIVVTALPSTECTSVMQDSVGVPSTRTVHAPH